MRANTHHTTFTQPLASVWDRVSPHGPGRLSGRRPIGGSGAAPGLPGAVSRSVECIALPGGVVRSWCAAVHSSTDGRVRRTSHRTRPERRSTGIRRAVPAPSAGCRVDRPVDAPLAFGGRRRRRRCLRRCARGDRQRKRAAGQLPQLSLGRRSQRLPLTLAAELQRRSIAAKCEPSATRRRSRIRSDSLRPTRWRGRSRRSSPRWQETLWLTEVEQRSAAEVAAHLQLAPNATAALTHRAREAFATAYLAEHIQSATDETCERYAPRLAAFVRGQLTDMQRGDVEQHLVDCPRCQQAVDELRDVNTSLRKLLPPATPLLAAPWTMGTHAHHAARPVQLRAVAQGRDRTARDGPAPVQRDRRIRWGRHDGGGRRRQDRGRRAVGIDRRARPGRRPTSTTARQR